MKTPNDHHPCWRSHVRANPKGNSLASPPRMAGKFPAAILAAVVLAGCEVPQVPASPCDRCVARLPVGLRDSLARRFPSHRPVGMDDYLKEDVAWFSESNHGERCLGVASADVNGDGSTDFAVLLTERAKAGSSPDSGTGRTLLVAARSAPGGSWVIDSLDEFGAERPCHSFVGTAEPGSYQDTFTSGRWDSPYTPAPGRVRKFEAVRPGFVAGRLESSAVAFFFTGRRWVHLWLSD
ncbi:MAG: hypothetical protein NTW21_06335 [Verrucomicrobia bacterium]|nr:hypothetical protein [Verrucomicrobiota bacterium]